MFRTGSGSDPTGGGLVVKITRERLESNIYLRKLEGCKTYRPYELLIGRTVGPLDNALRVFKKLYNYSDNVYIYKSGKDSYSVSIKEVFEELPEARLRKKQFFKIVGGVA